MKYLKDNLHIIEEGFEEMDQSFKGYSSKIKDLEIALGILPESESLALQSISIAPDKSISAVALYNVPEQRSARMLAHHGSMGSLSVGVPKAREKADAKAREEQARALVRRLADEKKKREQ